MAKKLEINEETLEGLINEVYIGVHGSLSAIDIQIVSLLSSIQNGGIALEQYGELLNDSLKTKAQSFDQLIKLAQVIKDRVRVKEQNKIAPGMENMLSPEELAEALSDVKAQMEEDKILSDDAD